MQDEEYQDEEFIPRNELEEELLRAQRGEIAGDVFMQDLLAAQVFMPVYEKYQIGGLQTSDKAQPLMLEGENGEQYLAVFTSPERAKPVTRDYPGYGGGLLVEFKWILEKTGGGVGLILNPGWSAGVEMESDLVQQLITTQ